MALLKAFLDNVFDTDLPKQNTDAFIVNENVEISKILGHPALKLNVFYCHLWKYIFKTFPSAQQYNNFVRSQGINLGGDIIIKAQMIDDFLNGMYIIKLGLVLKFNILEYSKFANELMTKLNDTQFLKDTIIEKIEYRYNAKLDRSSNLLYSFFNIAYNNTDILKLQTPTTVKNPFTDFELDITFPCCSNIYQNQLYAINEDVYFLNKLLNHPVVVVDMSNDSHTSLILDTITNVSKGFGKKCVVFSKSPLENTDCFQCHFIDSIHKYIPRIAPWCLMITDKVSDFHIGLAMQPEHNVLCILNEDAPASLDIGMYDRAITCNEDSQFSLHNNQTFWKYHIKNVNPEKAPHASNNVLLFIDFIFKYASRQCKHIPPPPAQSKKLILLIDNRENDLSVISCKCALINATGWHCRVITSKKASIYYERQLPMIQIGTHQLLEDQFDIDVYNTIMEDVDMWKGIRDDGYEHVLIIQDDGILIRPGVDEYLEYDYVGAPWADIPDNVLIKETITNNMVGNGGLSLRKVKTTIDVLEKYEDKKLQTFYHNINRIPEDVYYVKWLTRIGAKFPTKEQASAFSMEQVINIDCIGFHKFWCYHHYSEVKQIFKNIWDSIEAAQ